MEKIKLNIVGLSYSHTSRGAYVLLLGEEEGNRRVPIIIGAPEAQAIAIELEKMTPNRPLTHDLFKSFAESFSISLEEVIVYNLVEGVFFAKLYCRQGTDVIEIDARTSDAIALAVRFNCPIYTYEFILSSAGIFVEKGEEGVKAVKEEKAESDTESVEDLEKQLDDALKTENYEKASQLRDRIKNLKGNENDN
ncbi:MAG: bifunctional nuclease domain-containing protein [Luteibaculum sp.]